MDPGSGLLALGLAIAKLLLRWQDLQDPTNQAEALDDAATGFSALRRMLRPGPDPMGAAIAGELNGRLARVSKPSHLADLNATALNVAQLFSILAEDDNAILEAAVSPDHFGSYVHHHGGALLLKWTELVATPFAESVLSVASRTFSELAPRSPRFAPAALARILTQLTLLPEIAFGLESVKTDLDDARNVLADIRELVGGRRDVVKASKQAAKRGVVVGRAISTRDPAELGVHPAINVGGAVGTVPYITRAHDEQLRSRLARFHSPHARTGMVLVVGKSCTGKSRTLFEAIRAVLPTWSVATPHDDTELLALLYGGIPGKTVVWLDELQRYLTVTADGTRAAKGIEHLLRAAARNRPILFACTIWPDNLAGLAERPQFTDAQQGAWAISSMLARVEEDDRIDVPDGFTRAELLNAAKIDVRLRVAIEAATSTLHGAAVTQVLAGGVQLVHRMYPSGLGLRARAFSPAVRAIIYATAELRRVGVPNPVPLWALQGCAHGYLSQMYPDLTGRLNPDTWFREGLARATEDSRQDNPASGANTLDIFTHGVPALTARWDASITRERPPDESYDLHDYLYQDHLARQRTAPTVQAVWDCLSSNASRLRPDTLTSIGLSAAARGLTDSALAILHAHPSPTAVSTNVLGDLLSIRARGGDASAFLELRDRSKAGDKYAQRLVIQLLAKRAGDGNEAALSELQTLATTDPWAETELAHHLARAASSGGPDALLQLRALATAGGLTARLCLAQLLAERAGEEAAALTELRGLAANDDYFAQKSFVEFIAKRAKDDPEALVELRALARAKVVDANEFLTYHLAEQAAAGDSAAATELGQRVAASDWTARRWYADRVSDRAASGDAAAVVELRTLADADWTAQGHLVHYLGTKARHGDESALAELRQRASSHERDAQFELTGVLAARGDLAALAELLESAAAGNRHAVWALEAATNLGGGGDESPALAGLRRLGTANTIAPESRLDALALLAADFGDKAALGELRRLSRSGDRNARNHFAAILSKNAGEGDESALEELRGVANTGDRDGRYYLVSYASRRAAEGDASALIDLRDLASSGDHYAQSWLARHWRERADEDSSCLQELIGMVHAEQPAASQLLSLYRERHGGGVVGLDVRGAPLFIHPRT